MDDQNTKNFLEQIIETDIKSKKYSRQITTRFPPEPNGYLHIGHVKSIFLNFTISKKFEGKTHLRFDDTNPSKEEQIFIDSIKKDVQWLGYDWGNHLYYASDYFLEMYNLAQKLISKGNAFVCNLKVEQMREFRGTLSSSGSNSPYRERSIAENLELFTKMYNGEFEEGSCTLRAKIDMNSPNINMRDPVLYRIKFANHQRTKDKWCIYPTYDYAHCISDALENITHSICTLEFADHKPLYNWILQKLDFKNPPTQHEFSRLNLTYTITSKRKLSELIDNKIIKTWDDPRLPTISGMRRRGYPAQSLKNFCDQTGVSRTIGCTEIELLENCVRDELDKNAPRAFAIINPIKLIIDNYPNDETETFTLPLHPKNPNLGTRTVIFGKELYIEAEDFMENPDKKFFRLSIDKEIRLRGAYIIKCTHIKKDINGKIISIHAIYDPETKGGNTPDGKKIKSTIHWLEAKNALVAEFHLYDKLFTEPAPNINDLLKNINLSSLKIRNGFIESRLINEPIGKVFQFERIGYFCIDKNSKPNNMIFNQTVSLRSTK